MISLLLKSRSLRSSALLTDSRPICGLKPIMREVFFSFSRGWATISVLRRALDLAVKTVDPIGEDSDWVLWLVKTSKSTSRPFNSITRLTTKTEAAVWIVQ